MNALDRIQKNYESFTKTEQEIAIYILNHPLEIARKPIIDVAESSHTSKTALIRFTQKIGYSGFSEFRFDLSRSLIRSTEQEENIKSDSIINAIGDAYISCIQQLKTSILQEDLDIIAKKMISARRIKILGYETLQATVDTFNKCVDGEETDEFGRTLYSTKLENGPWVATARQACVHHTMGGVTIDTDTHVLDESGKAIEGLYAAGEVTGGIHGANRLGGNAVVDTVVFGRTAGEQVVADNK